MLIMWFMFGIVAIVAFGFASIKLNVYSEREYGYEPINAGTILFGFIPFIILLVGQYGEHNGDNGSLQIAIFFSLILFIGLTWWIAQKTSIETAIAASVMVLTISLALFAIVIMLAMGKEASRNNDYYYDND